ncbi:MAG: hypothetical protein K6E50_15210 [Lachnospiraceae bacterium]|nr:hypothetical protein [Lachnospiraceae bacterium]
MVNREHKDRLFKMIFGREEHRDWTLSLYNAVNGTSYDDPSMIEFNTMEDVLFMGMKNDASFLLDSHLSLWEHQSTPVPNAPLRCVMYLGRLWSKQYIGIKTLYSRKTITLPVPRCVIFYNGMDDEEEQKVLKLSDAFPVDKGDEADVELRVRLINVNRGHNRRLMEVCRPMYEYAWLIDRIRENCRSMGIEAASLRAIEEMPENFRIKGFLLENKEEVQMSMLTEYNEEETLRIIAKEEREEGRAEGKEEGSKRHLIAQICKKMQKGKDVEQIADEVEEELSRVQKICEIAQELGPEYDADKVFESVRKRIPNV